MPTAIFILAAALFAADAAAHLAAVAQKKERLRRVTKVLLMPLLALAFSLCALTVYNEAPPWLVVAALSLGCAGDTLLLNHHHKVGLPLGLASFAAGHVLYIVQICLQTPPPVWWADALPALACAVFAAVFYSRLRPHLPKAYRPMALFYMLLLSALSASAAASLIAAYDPGKSVLLAGTLLFMLSDAILSFEVFRGETRNGNFKVMAAYIAAQTLIATGFLVWMA